MTYGDKHKRLMKYLKMKVSDRDWHAVSDAANDLRVLEAEQRTKDYYNHAFQPGSVVLTDGPPI